MLFMTAILGVAFGFAGSIPIAGPMAILVIGHGLEDRLRSGLCLAAGAALAESVYVYLAFWGFARVLERHAWIVSGARVTAIAVLIVLGVRFLRIAGSSPSGPTRAGVGGGFRSFVTGLALMAMNPALIAVWGLTVSVLHDFDIVQLRPADALAFSLGACLGIFGWFVTLLHVLQRVGRGRSRAWLDGALRGTGALLILLGLALAGLLVCGAIPE